MSEVTEAKIADNVLLEWTGIGAKHIATEMGNAFLIPKSVTPVPTAVWEIARPWFVANGTLIPSKDAATPEDLTHGRIIEHGVKVDVKEVVPAKKGPGGRIVDPAITATTITSTKDLMDLPDSEARLLIAKIFDPVLLQSYLESPAMDEFQGLKGAIERQLKVVETGGKKKGK